MSNCLWIWPSVLVFLINPAKILYAYCIFYTIVLVPPKNSYLKSGVTSICGSILLSDIDDVISRIRCAAICLQNKQCTIYTYNDNNCKCYGQTNNNINTQNGKYKGWYGNDSQR